MTPNEIYWLAIGQAHVRGVEGFETLMPHESAMKLIFAWLSHSGFAWVEANAVSYLVNIAGRRLRSNRPPCPPRGQRCKWRKSMKQEHYSTLRPTALRVEVMAPEDRCGWRLRGDCIGGHFFDYLPCLRPITINLGPANERNGS